MNDIPSYNDASKTETDISNAAMLMQFSRRMPKPCSHQRKRLFKVLNGEAMDYHLMQCVKCKMCQIWPLSKSGKVLMNSDFTKPHRFFIK